MGQVRGRSGRARRAGVVAVLASALVVAGAPTPGSSAAASDALAGGTTSAGSTEPGAPVVEPQLHDRAQAEGAVPVLVELAVPDRPRAPGPSAPDPTAVAEHRATIATAQQAAISALPATARRIHHRYATIPALALTASPRALAALERAPGVMRVVPDGLEAPALAEAVPHIEGTDLHAEGLDGAGHAVAIVDTGVDREHPALEGRVVHEACFAHDADRSDDGGACPDGSSEQIGPDAAAPVEIDEEPSEHGTHVAGIAAGAGSSTHDTADADDTGTGTGDEVAPGVAPAADVVAVQVFHPRDGQALAWRSDVLAGLDHLVGLADGTVAADGDPLDLEQGSVSLAAANLSLGSGSYGSVEDCADTYAGFDLFAWVATELADLGAAVVSSAGNGGNDEALSGPACVAGIVSVSATELTVDPDDDDPEPEPPDEPDTDEATDTAPDETAAQATAQATAPDDGSADEQAGSTIASFADVAAFLDLLAPGVRVTSAVPGGGVEDKSGTSMAAPMVSGAWAALQGASTKQHAPADVLAALHKTGSPTSRDGLAASHPEVRLHAALRELTHPTPHTLSLDLDPEEVLAGSAAAVELTLVLRDAADQPVTDREVEVRNDGAGQLGDGDDGDSTVTLSTDAEGTAQTSYVAEDDPPGTVTFTADSAGLDADAEPVTATLTVWDPDEPTLALTVDPQELTSGTGEQAELTARLETRKGEALDEQDVAFGHDGGGSLSPQEATTDALGVATATYTEDDEPGEVELTATHVPDDPDGAGLTEAVTVTIGAPPSEDDDEDDSGGSSGGGGGGGSAPAPDPDDDPDPEPEPDDPEPEPDDPDDEPNDEDADAADPLRRIGGATRYETAANLSAGIFEPGVSHAYLATGADFADALPGAVAAARADAPLLLVPPTGTVPEAVAAELARLDPAEVVILGGTSAISDDIAGQVSALTGLTPQRVHGANRYATAAAIAADLAGAGTDTVVVATGERFPDGLAGAPVAAEEGGPLLLTRTERVPDETASELARLEPAEVVVLGGTSVVSEATADALRDHAGGAELTRLGGADRYATAALAMTRLPDPQAAFLATGGDFADALAGAAVAGAEGSPILLTAPTQLPDPTRTAVTDLAPARLTILGGSTAVSSEVEAELGALLR